MGGCVGTAKAFLARTGICFFSCSQMLSACAGSSVAVSAPRNHAIRPAPEVSFCREPRVDWGAVREPVVPLRLPPQFSRWLSQAGARPVTAEVLESWLQGRSVVVRTILGVDTGSNQQWFGDACDFTWRGEMTIVRGSYYLRGNSLCTPLSSGYGRCRTGFQTSEGKKIAIVGDSHGRPSSLEELIFM